MALLVHIFLIAFAVLLMNVHESEAGCGCCCHCCKCCSCCTPCCNPPLLIKLPRTCPCCCKCCCPCCCCGGGGGRKRRAIGHLRSRAAVAFPQIHLPGVPMPSNGKCNCAAAAAVGGANANCRAPHNDQQMLLKRQKRNVPYGQFANALFTPFKIGIF